MGPFNNRLGMLNRTGWAERIVLTGAFIFGLALPTSTALVSLAVLLIAAGLCANYRSLEIKKTIRDPLVYLPLLLFFGLFVSLYWSQAGNPADYLSKYRKLIFVFPFALMFVAVPSSAKSVLSGFLWGNGIALVLSIYCWASQQPLGYGSPDDPSVLKKHITHNFFMAMAVIAWLDIAVKRYGRSRMWMPLLALVFLGIVNVWLMVDGRTGQLALLAGLITWSLFRFKRVKLSFFFWGGVFASIFFSAVFYFDALHLYFKGIEEISICQASLSGAGAPNEHCNTSMGARLSFTTEVFSIVKQNPMGIGVGGFPEPILNKFHNPHNDYLLYLMQLGWVGLAAYLLLVFVFAYRSFSAMKGAAILSSFAIVYILGNMFNSFSLDFNEGHLYVLLIGYVASLSIEKRGFVSASENADD